jgi:hypothetical protein
VEDALHVNRRQVGPEEEGREAVTGLLFLLAVVGVVLLAFR